MATKSHLTLQLYCLIFGSLYCYANSLNIFKGHADVPLILTPYIEKGNIELAQELSRVPLTEHLGFKSHAGFITVDKRYDSNLFFWYFPAFNKDKNAPVVLWLQGGPGTSSLTGLFAENGPLIATETGFTLRRYHWAVKYNVIYIDNPVGAGFSFTTREGYCTNEKCVAQHLYNCLQQILLMFPVLRHNEFYIAGESYAGKHIPALGMEIHKQNSNRALKINLKGLALGNAICDPINQMDYGSYLYQLGLIDKNQKKIMSKVQKKLIAEIKKENWIQAYTIRNELVHGYITNYTGFENIHNYVVPKQTPGLSNFKILLNDEVRRSLHVGSLALQTGEEVRNYLAGDLMQSMAPYISELLSHYRLMFYNGQLDITVPYTTTVNFIRKLKFSSSDEYKKASRSIWRVDGEVAGYVKTAGNLTEVLVRNAGHAAPHDQPKWVLDLITRFIEKSL